jgi:hypothetical protein
MIGLLVKSVVWSVTLPFRAVWSVVGPWVRVGVFLLTLPLRLVVYLIRGVVGFARSESNAR